MVQSSIDPIIEFIQSKANEHEWISATLIFRVLDATPPVSLKSRSELAAQNVHDLNREISFLIEELEARSRFVPKEIVDFEALANIFKMVRYVSKSGKSKLIHSAVIGAAAATGMTLGKLRDEYLRDYQLLCDFQNGKYVEPGHCFDIAAAQHTDLRAAVKSMALVPHRSLGDRNKDELVIATFQSLSIAFADTAYGAYSDVIFSRHQIGHKIDFDKIEPLTAVFMAWLAIASVDVMIYDFVDLSDVKQSIKESNRQNKRWRKSTHLYT